jgi:hypothetical protein
MPVTTTAQVTRPGPAVAPATLAPPTLARMPRFFVATVEFAVGNGPLQVRASGTGRLVSQDEWASGATGLTAAGRHSLVIALPVRGACATRLYRLRLSGRRLSGRAMPVGRKLPGELWSVTASADGQVIGYAISGCAKGDPGYIGVSNVRTGRTLHWGDVSLGGVSPGNVALSGGLSMSASGSMLAFTGWDLTPAGQVLRQVVRVLPTASPPGTVASRSRTVLSRPASEAALQSVALSPDGASFYLCTASASGRHRTTTVAAYRTVSGHRERTIATLSGGPLLQGCPMALDASGHFLLVPYGLRGPHSPAGRWLLQIASIDVATSQAVTLDLCLPPNAGMDAYAGMRVAW